MLIPLLGLPSPTALRSPAEPIYVVSIAALELSRPLLTSNAWQSTESPGPSAPTRVRVKLDGFDISGKLPNQIGTGSHEVPTSPLGAAAPSQKGKIQPFGSGLISLKGLNSAATGTGTPAPAAPTALRLYAPPAAKAYSLTPTFYWNAVDPQREFVLRIDRISADAVPLYSVKIAGGRFTYPASAPALEPAKSYRLTLRSAAALINDTETVDFMIVGGAERAAIDRKLADAATAAGATPSPEAALQTASAQAQVMVDARIWFDALNDYTTLIEQHPAPQYYRQRSALYDQVPAAYPLADADFIKANQ